MLWDCVFFVLVNFLELVWWLVSLWGCNLRWPGHNIASISTGRGVMADHPSSSSSF